MDYYVDMKVLQDPDMSRQVLMESLYGKAHRRMADLDSSNVGATLPGYLAHPATVGSSLRLHGTKERLTELLADLGWLHGMRGYVDVGGPKQVPPNHSWVRVYRVQDKSAARKWSGLAKKHGISTEEAMRKFPDIRDRRSNLPHFFLSSQSTKMRFALAIRQEHADGPSDGHFNTYGLSREAAVPWF